MSRSFWESYASDKSEEQQLQDLINKFKAKVKVQNNPQAAQEYLEEGYKK
jgi:hypothetical protein